MPVGANPWLVLADPPEAARVRLFCFHHAAGGASLFRGWQRELGPEIAVLAIQLPGRERRIREPPMTEITPVVAAISEAMADWLDRPFILFGHSMGAVLAHGVLRALAGHGALAHGLIVSAHPPLGTRRASIRQGVRRSELPDDELVAMLKGYNGTPPEALENRQLRDLFLPLLRADLRMIESRAPGSEGVPCPLLVLSGAGDRSAGPAVMAGWRRLSSGPVHLQSFAGGHFYLRDQPAAVCKAVRSFALDVISREVVHSVPIHSNCP